MRVGARRAGAAAAIAVVVLSAAGPVAGVTGDPVVASLSDGGVNRVGVAGGAAISADGRYVAFVSADAMTAVPTNGVAQLYVRDLQLGRTMLASASPSGAAADQAVDDPAGRIAYAISGDGRFVVFASGAGNLVTSDPDAGQRDVFRKDLLTGAVEVVSVAAGGGPANAAVAGDPDVSYDGSMVAFETGAATNIWSGDVATGSDLVVTDMRTHVARLASVSALGGVLPGPLGEASLSADGSAVAFRAGADVLLRDLRSATTVLVGPGASPDVSGSGGVVAFASSGAVRVFTRSAGAIATIAPSGTDPRVSADGARVVYVSPDDLAPGDGNGVVDIYARPAAGGAPQRVSERAGAPVEVDRASTVPAMAANGGPVAFVLDDGPAPAQSLVAGDADLAPDVLVGRLPPTDVTGPLLTAAAVTDPQPGPAATITGSAADPSGLVSVTVAGAPAVVDASGTYAVQVPVSVGANTFTVRAIDGAGNVTERDVAVTRAGAVAATPAAAARARALVVSRQGRDMIVRFRLDAGAARVSVRLLRRVNRIGQSPAYVPVGAPRVVPTTAGSRVARVRRLPLPSGVYQIRISVVSAGGVAVAAVRQIVTRSSLRR